MKHLLATLLLLFGAAAGAYAEDAYLINPGDVLQVFGAHWHAASFHAAMSLSVFRPEPGCLPTPASTTDPEWTS